MTCWRIGDFWRQYYTVSTGVSGQAIVVGGCHCMDVTEKRTDSSGKTTERTVRRPVAVPAKTISAAPCALEVSALRAIYQRKLHVSPSSVGKYLYETYRMQYF